MLLQFNNIKILVDTKHQIMLSYPIHLEAKFYTDDVGYRIFMRNLFSMKHNCPWDHTNVDEVDDVSLDEWDYDDESITELLNSIHNETNKMPIFNNLYILAAGKMMSQDSSIGLAVLFSYNFAHLFHRCIIYHINEIDLKTSPEFIKLNDILTQK
jgi:hypothetical protein